MPGTITASMEVRAPVRLNICSQPAGSFGECVVAKLNRLGLGHFGFGVENLAAELDSLEIQSAMHSSQRWAPASIEAYLRDSL